MSNQRVRNALALLLWGAALGLAYGQSPLYTSNQNQYFLHGFAQAGVGRLSADWLAGTRDPTPLFSLLARLMALTSPPVLNYLLYGLIFAIYLAAIFGIARRLFEIDRRPSQMLLFLAMVIASHSAALRVALSYLPGGEWGYLFDGGVGGQRLLGPVFQPSVFGVLLLLSIWLYLEDRPLPAMLTTALAGGFHPTYLLSAAALSAVYWADLLRRTSGWRRPLIAAGATLALVSPIVIYTFANFLPPSAAAQQIIVEFRIPDHALPAEWFDLTSLAKIAMIAGAIAVARKTRVLPVLLTLLAVGGTLTLLQVLTGSNSLALLFPWRLSTVLVPLSTALLAGRLAAALDSASGRSFRAAGLTVAGLAVVSGIAWSAVQFAQQRSMPERGALDYVRSNLSPGQQYLTPPKMQDFRLATGAPALADFKAIPYRGAEVLEWYQRVRLLQFFYRSRPEEVDCGLLEVFSGEYGVTHVVLEPEQRGLACEPLELLYDDGGYGVYRIAQPAP